MFSKYIENYEIILALEHARKYTCKKRKNILTKFVRQYGINFRRLNYVKNMLKNNILENPRHKIKVDNQYAYIISLERTAIVYGQEDFRFVCRIDSQ